MAHINTTGNADIDGATSEIASALRHASPVDYGDQYFYDEAMRLRDAIMAGTRELDAEPPSENWMAGDREAVLADADDAVEAFRQRFTWGI